MNKLRVALKFALILTNWNVKLPNGIFSTKKEIKLDFVGITCAYIRLVKIESTDRIIILAQDPCILKEWNRFISKFSNKIAEAFGFVSI